MFCFQIHARAYCTMNEKFSILHEAKLSAVNARLPVNYIYYGLETVVSVLFSNTRTRLLYNEREISAKLSAVLKISSSLYSKQVRVFENKTRTNSL